ATVAGVLIAATISEGLVALGVVGLSPSTGDWDVRDVLVVGAFCALFFGGPVFVAAAFTRFADELRPGVPVVALATGAVVVARFLSYDPYYAPYLRRMSDGGILPGWWIVVLAGAAIGAAVIARRDPRMGLVLTGVVMFLAGPTIFVSGLGH
ncbi:MAG: hypothetical protein ACRDQC_05225, partial [Gaiellales bacterium]